MDFLPDYGHLLWKGRYRPMFRLFASEGWRYVRKDGKPVECDTAAQAISAAKECVRAILNPEIRAEQAENPLADEVTLWRRRRAEEAAEAQETALGAVLVKGRQIKVERVGRRALA